MPFGSRAELSRLLFVAGGITFEDERIEYSTLPTIRHLLPLDQVPILTIDGTVYPQSMAIARYAARLAGLYPVDLVDAIKADVIVETLEDIMPPMIAAVTEKDEEAMTEKLNAFTNETIPKLLDFIESQVQGKFVLGSTMSYADVYLFSMTQDMVVKFVPDCKLNQEKYPEILRVVENVKANDKIAAYLTKRP